MHLGRHVAYADPRFCSCLFQGVPFMKLIVFGATGGLGAVCVQKAPATACSSEHRRTAPRASIASSARACSVSTRPARSPPSRCPAPAPRKELRASLRRVHLDGGHPVREPAIRRLVLCVGLISKHHRQRRDLADRRFSGLRLWILRSAHEPLRGGAAIDLAARRAAVQLVLQSRLRPARPTLIRAIRVYSQVFWLGSSG